MESILCAVLRHSTVNKGTQKPAKQRFLILLLLDNEMKGYTINSVLLDKFVKSAQMVLDILTEMKDDKKYSKIIGPLNMHAENMRNIVCSRDKEHAPVELENYIEEFPNYIEFTVDFLNKVEPPIDEGKCSKLANLCVGIESYVR